ncbi:hypothetical protein Tco_1021678, partial [Tanacetum coccineum]
LPLKLLWDLDSCSFSLNLVLSFFQSFDLDSCPLDQLGEHTDCQRGIPCVRALVLLLHSF